MLCIFRSKGTQCTEHEYNYDGTYYVNVNVFFLFVKKAGYRLKSPSSTQSRSMTPSLDTPIRCRVGGVTSWKIKKNRVLSFDTV